MNIPVLFPGLIPVLLNNLKISCYVKISMETVSDFIFLGSKITADGDCSHEIMFAHLPNYVWFSHLLI